AGPGGDHQLGSAGAELGPHHPLAHAGQQQYAQAVLDALRAPGVAEPARVVRNDREPPPGADEVLGHGPTSPALGVRVAALLGSPARPVTTPSPGWTAPRAPGAGSPARSARRPTDGCARGNRRAGPVARPRGRPSPGGCPARSRRRTAAACRRPPG